MLIAVVLPAPLCPSKANTSCYLILKDILSTAMWSPNFFESLLI
jgi:hypothetical protein